MMSNISLTAPAQYVTVIGEVQAKGQKTMGMAQGDIHLLLRERRHLSAGDDDNFSVMDTKEIANMLTGTTTLLTTLLSAVAAVSLLVGGIGIMNIMLVSVTERTRERGSIPTGARASAGGSGAAIGDGSGYGSRRRWRAA